MRQLLAGLAVFAFLVPLAADIRPEQRRSGFEMMGPEAQAMQRDDFSNPAMLSVRVGEALWSRAPAEGKPSCQSCHGGPEAMVGVAARYPTRETRGGRVIDLAGQVQSCQSVRQGIAPSSRESRPLLALEALIALQSRGQAIQLPSQRGLAETVERGRALYTRRMGQLDLACAQCHSENWGNSLAGTVIPQAHPTGYPIFRMEWQATGSLHRRLRNCLTGVRAESFAAGSDEFIALETYLMERAAGMAMDAPAVRP
jgi:sulfur-oxidizing protein SoxA